MAKSNKTKYGFGRVKKSNKKRIDISEYKGIRSAIDIGNIVTRSAQDMVENLKELSPKGARFKNGSGESYASGWTYEYSPYNDTAIVYNETNYRLAHLLEYGHTIDNTRDSSKRGWAAPQPHIIKAFQKVAPQFVKKMYDADVDIEFE